MVLITVANILPLLTLVVWPLMAFISMFAFDDPKATESILVLLVVASVWIYPVPVVIGLWRTLEMLVDHPDTPELLREKSWFLAAKLLEKLQLHDAALGYYERFAERYPASQYVAYAQIRLEALRVRV